MLRTKTCGELTRKNVDETVALCGWVHRWRDHGGVIFIDLRDRYGLTQIKFDPELNKKTHCLAEKLRSEWVIKATGKVVARPGNMINSKLKTGEIEIEVNELEVLSQSKTPPFELEEEKKIEVREELRMKYRYIDIRKSEIKEILMKRHEFISFVRDYLNKKDFIEVETPVLTKSTPEGARDFLVPNRLHPGEFYALPQSPQQYKQLLMIGGLDRYYQIAKCFRDEDTRGDRQAEFTQLDIEMSFVKQNDILELTEDMFTKAISQIFPEKKIMKSPWPRLDYDEVMLKYGIDKPDLRFDLEIKDITKLMKGCDFKVFADAVDKGGVVRAIRAPKAAKFTRKEIDNLISFAQDHGAKGLAYIVVKNENELQSPIVKFLGDKLAGEIVKEMQAKSGDIIFFGADRETVVCEYLSAVRQELGRKLGLIDENLIALAFIINFPLFEPGLQDGHYAPGHHMFTQPQEADIKKLKTEPGKARSYQH
ncbi:MAG: aspartate--tRNA ligase, partial [Elusimicrobiales bacterium]|nr:aspartate--tRNA ligase [Elusimicrobiales bacterium]